MPDNTTLIACMPQALLDLYGDGRLCLPLKQRQDDAYDWLIETKRAERKPIKGNPYYHGRK